LALAGSNAASGFARAGRIGDAPAVVATHESPPVDGLVPVTPPAGALTAVIRDHRQPLSKLLVALLVIVTVTVAPARSLLRRRRPPLVTDAPGPSIRRRGPPATCFSASI
jgi:hypothetical protein